MDMTTPTPHDGAQTQGDDSGTDQPANGQQERPPAEQVQPALAAPGKPDGEVDTRH